MWARNSLSELSNREHFEKFNRDTKKPDTLAFDENLKEYRLCELSFVHVEFIGGLWRVQRKFNGKIKIVRDREFVLKEILPNKEKNNFVYYRALMVGQNCYGKDESSSKNFIVANYDKYWSYGDSIEQARAFLGIKLFDTYNHLIFAEIEREKKK